LHDRRGGFQAACVQFARGRLERVDLVGAEAITGALVPVNAIHRMEREAQAFDLGRPVGPRNQRLAAHAPRQDADERPEAPKPPRVTLPEACEVLSTAWLPGRAPLPVHALPPR